MLCRKNPRGIVLAGFEAAYLGNVHEAPQTRRAYFEPQGGLAKTSVPTSIVDGIARLLPGYASASGPH